MTVIPATRAEMAAYLERRKSGETLADEAERLASDFHAFVRAAWHVIEPGTEFVDGWHIREMCRFLTRISRGEVRKGQLWVPPGHMKSRTASILWPAWEWTWAPWLKYWTGSYDLSLSQDFTVRALRLIQSDWYQARWPIAMVKENERYYENTEGGARLATSPTAGGTGRHGHRILLDDPLDPEKAESWQAPALNRANGWYDGTISTRGVGETAEVIIMQRIHEDDVAAHALAHGGGWEVLCLPETYEADHPYAYAGDRREEGELLWPALFGPEKHAERLRMGAHKAAGRLQQRPAAREGEILKRAAWRYYDPKLLDAAERGDTSKLPAFTRVFSDWDTSFKDKSSSDYVAGGIWGVYRGDRYLLRVYHERARLSRTKTLMLEARAWILERWPHAATNVVIEKAANGVEIIEELEREIPGVVAYVASTDKVSRAEAAEPDFESGNVFVPGYGLPDLSGYDARTPDAIQKVIEECAAFPNASHDDLVDMVTMALNWVRTKGNALSTITTPDAPLPSMPVPGGGRGNPRLPAIGGR